MLRLLGLVAFAAGELAVLVACVHSGKFSSRHDGHVKVSGNPHKLKNVLRRGFASVRPPHGRKGAMTSFPGRVFPQRAGGDSPAEASRIAFVGALNGTTVARRSSPSRGSPLGLLPEKFTNVAEIGSGSHGSVFSATYGNRQVAIKLPSDFSVKYHASLPPHLRKISLDLELREFQIGYDMKYGGGHGNKGAKYIMDSIETNIDEVLALGVQPYMVFDFCGTDLREFLVRRKAENALNEALLLDIYTQVLKALAYLRRHPNRWVHRDLAVENIGVLEIDGKVEVRLIDFGLAVKGLPGHEKDISHARLSHRPPRVKPNHAFEVLDDPTDVNNFSRIAQSYDVFGLHKTFFQMLGCSETFVDATAKNPPQTPEEIVSVVDQVVMDMKEKGILDHDRDSGIRDVIAMAIRCFHEDPEERPTAEELLKFMEARRNLDLRGPD